MVVRCSVGVLIEERLDRQDERLMTSNGDDCGIVPRRCDEG